jgi:hypothetical protein
MRLDSAVVISENPAVVLFDLTVLSLDLPVGPIDRTLKFALGFQVGLVNGTLELLVCLPLGRPPLLLERACVGTLWHRNLL